MLYLQILCNLILIFLIFELSKINYARTLLITDYWSLFTEKKAAAAFVKINQSEA